MHWRGRATHGHSWRDWRVQGLYHPCGSGPFPTELLGEEGERIRTAGNEFGAVTGRPRRCGWFDVPLLRYTAMINGFTSLVITKLDVLDQFDEIRFVPDTRM